MAASMQDIPAERPFLYKDPGSSQYQRTFRFDSSTGQLQVPNPCIAGEQLLQQHRDNYTGMKALRAQWKENIINGWWCRSATCFALAAPDGEAWWCSAGRILFPELQYEWMCGYGQEVLPDRARPRVKHQVVDLRWLTGQLPESERTATAPSNSNRLVPAFLCAPSDNAVIPGFGFIRTANPTVQPVQLFIPCADQPANGQHVGIIGIAEDIEPEWALTSLRLEDDYLEVQADCELEGTEPPPDWQLDARLAWHRATWLSYDVVHPYRLAVSPGQITAANSLIIEHTCSSFPGMTGAAGVDLQQPWRLRFVHLAADMEVGRDVSYGSSVNHPLFVKAYVREVLPKLLITPRSLFKSGMLECLLQYLIAHKDLLEDMTVLDRVQAML